MALEHLLNTSERERCVQMVTELVLPTYSAGQMSTVQRWLAALGDEAIEAYPPLAVLAGWVAVLGGDPLEAQRWAAVADAATFDMVPWTVRRRSTPHAPCCGPSCVPPDPSR